MATATVNESVHRQEAQSFEYEVWDWLAPLIGAGVGAGLSEAGQMLVSKTTGYKLSGGKRVALDASAALLGWLVEAGRRPTPAQKKRVDWDYAKSARGAAWQGDLTRAAQTAFRRSDVNACAFFGLPVEAIEISPTELESVIERRRTKIVSEHRGAARELMLAGCDGFAERVRALQRRGAR